MRWEVQHHTLCGGWANTWTCNEVPQTFATPDEAQAEIEEFLSEINAEIASGERDPDNGYTAEEFRVVRVDKEGAEL